MDVKTRSISSSIVDFFRRTADRDAASYNGNSAGPGIACETAAENGANDTTMGFHGSMYSMDGEIAPPDFKDSMIVYETEADGRVRPPILPILPVQRLRLLRQKQEWRRRVSSSMLLALSGPPGTGSDISVLNPSFSRESSSTPSPVKKAVIKDLAGNLKTLKRTKADNGRSRGTKWTAEFEYDLSEYDNHKKEAGTTSGDPSDYHMGSPTLSVVKRSSMHSEYPQDIGTNTLSKAQREVLLKGQPAGHVGTKNPAVVSDSRKLTLKPDGKEKRETDKNILPSVGFDFIKANDTPSKISSAKSSGLQTPTDSKTNAFKFSSQTKQSNNPEFSFAASKTDNKSQQRETEHGDEDEPRRKKTAFRNSDGTRQSALAKSEEALGDASGKSQFAFGSTTTPDGKKASIPSFTFGRKPETTSEPKPVVSFGKEVTGDQKAKTTGAPSFSFPAKHAKENPSFSFGGKPNDTTTAADSLPSDKLALVPAEKSAIPEIDSSAPKLTFNFSGGADPSKEQTEKSVLTLGGNDVAEKNSTAAAPAFSFGKGAVMDKKDASTAPAFSFGKGAAIDKKDASTAPAFSFGKGAVTDKKVTSPAPAFSFTNAATKAVSPAVPALSGGAEVGLDKNPATTGPSFSFGNGASTDSKNPPSVPSFSFGNDSTKGSTAPSSFSFSKDSGSVARKEPSNSAFNFGSKDAPSTKPEAATKPAAGFSFSRPPDGNAAKPSFSFGKSDALENNTPSFGLANPPATALPASTNSGFNFNKGSNLGTEPNPNDAKAAGTSFGFKFGSGSNSPVTTEQTTTAGVSSNANPFINGSKPNNGFTFGTSAGNAGATTQPLLHQPQPLQSGLGRTPSPAFGKSASPPVDNGSNNPSRAFTPSNTINLNFGNSGSVNPSAVFSGIPGPAAPQQVFGSTPPPSQIFGAAPQAPNAFNNAPMGFGAAGGIAAGQPAPMAQQQAPAQNFQIPPGRKLARMRQSRR